MLIHVELSSLYILGWWRNASGSKNVVYRWSGISKSKRNFGNHNLKGHIFGLGYVHVLFLRRY